MPTSNKIECRKIGIQGNKSFRRVKHIKIYRAIGKCKRTYDVLPHHDQSPTQIPFQDQSPTQIPFQDQSPTQIPPNLPSKSWPWLWLLVYLILLALGLAGCYEVHNCSKSYGLSNFFHHFCHPAYWWNTVVFFEDPLASKGKYAGWNNGKYNYTNSLVDRERWKCIVVGCNNSLYLDFDGNFLDYESHTNSDFYSIQQPQLKKCRLSAGRSPFHKHNPNKPHKMWTTQQIVIQNAQQAMINDVTMGSDTYSAYNNYVLHNADLSHYIPPRSRFKNKLKAVRRKFYPTIPNMTSIDESMKENAKEGWTGNYYVRQAAVLKQRITDNKNEQFTQWVQQTNGRFELESKRRENALKIAELQQQNNLITGKITEIGGKDFHSQFYIGTTASGKQIIFGEKEAYQCAWECEVWQGDETWKPTPTVAVVDGLSMDMTWMIHGLKQSSTLIYAHEAFSLFYIFFQKGKDTRTWEHYNAALEVIVQQGIIKYDINLLMRCKRVICDFSKALRLGFVAGITVYKNLCDGCNYHWVRLIENGIKEYDLWDLYLKNEQFKFLMRILKCVKDAPIGRMLEAYDLVYEAIPQYTPKKRIKGVQKMCLEYVVPVWTVDYQPQEYNAFKKWVAHNCHVESKNLRVQQFVGVHKPWYQCIEKLQQWSQLEMARYRQYKYNGFMRKKSLKEHTKKAALNKMWKRISNACDTSQKLKLWDYLEGVSYIYAGEWNTFDEKFGALTHEEIDF
eukprot:63581_1